MRTVYLSLLSILLILLPASVVKSNFTIVEHNSIPIWSRCTTKTNQHLSPKDLKEIKNTTCADPKDKGVCFGKEVSRLCKERNTLEEDAVLCLSHTIFYNRYRGTKETQTLSMKNSMKSACENHAQVWNVTKTNCKDVVPPCIHKISKEHRILFAVENIAKKAEAWCGSYTGTMVEDSDQGEDIAYRCYEQLSNSESSTRDWLTNDVARCTFHSIFKYQNETSATAMHSACEYLKSFGYHGHCNEMETKCYEVMESVYNPTVPPSVSTDALTAGNQTAAESGVGMSSVIYLSFIVPAWLFSIL